MLRKIKIGDYDCSYDDYSWFYDKDIVPIAPLTVVCGVNDSGKSSIIDGLLYCRELKYEEASRGKSFLGLNVINKIKELINSKETTKLLPPDVVDVEEQQLFQAFNAWLRYFGIGDCCMLQNNADDPTDIQLKIGTHRLDRITATIGYGTNDIVSLIVNSLLEHNDKVLWLKSPEAYLHPNLQLAMADLLLSLMKNGKRIVVETHSDHILNRLLRRIIEDEQDNLIKDKIKIYFISNDGHDGERYSTIQEIKVDPVRGFVDAPLDFFSQFSAEITEIFNAGIENLKRKEKESAQR